MQLPADLRAGPGQMESGYPLPFPWNRHSFHCSHARSSFKDAALRKHWVTESIWTVHMTEPYGGLYINPQDSTGQMQKSTSLVNTQDKPHV